MTFNNADEIIPGLWLGNYKSAFDKNFLKENNIKVIINCTKDLPFLNKTNIFKYRIPIDDNLQLDEIMSMSDWINLILPIINKHHYKNNNILIHCYAGIQRSAIVMLSYLYKYNIASATKAFKLIKYRRPIAFTPKMNFKLSFHKQFGFTFNTNKW